MSAPYETSTAPDGLFQFITADSCNMDFGNFDTGSLDTSNFDTGSLGTSSLDTSTIPSSDIPAVAGSAPAVKSESGSQPAPPPPVAAPNKPPRILACVLCQHRKIKCDRSFPCANCIKAQVKCTPSTPAPARKRRRPNQDLQERLARCEAMLQVYTSEKPESSDPPATPAAFSDKSQMGWQPSGKLVRHEGSMRFMDSPLLVVYDELRAMKEIVDNDDSDDSSPESMSPDENSELILGGDTPAVNVESLWPDAHQIFPLWQVYLDRVNPLTKIIHVPSVQPYLAEAVNRPQNVSKNIEALLFSIFLMAVVALSPEECQAMMDMSREEALNRYSKGARVSLIQSGFLKSNDLVTLQALVIYLISLQGRYNRHAAWILNGTAIRIAQKMGLHIDGESLGLSPFESEMRRRVWWQIFMVDSKYAIFSGLSHSLLPRNCSTKPPKNVNDADIFPDATEPIQDREGPTEMIFCLLTYRFAKFVIDNPNFESMFLIADRRSGENHGGPTDEQLKVFRRGFAQLHDDLITLIDRFSDPSAGPVHKMAGIMRDHVMEKFADFINPPKAPLETNAEVKTAQDKALHFAVTTLEHNEANYKATKEVPGFAWFSLLHFQVELFMFVAGHLCHRTEGELVERAWRQVGVVYTFHPELFDLRNKNYGALATFILKAWQKREQKFLTATGQFPETPFYVEKLRAAMPSDNYKTEEPTPSIPDTPADFALALDPGAGVGETTNSMWDYFVPNATDWDMFGPPPTAIGATGQVARGFAGYSSW